MLARLGLSVRLPSTTLPSRPLGQLPFHSAMPYHSTRADITHIDPQPIEPRNPIRQRPIHPAPTLRDPAKLEAVRRRNRIKPITVLARVEQAVFA